MSVSGDSDTLKLFQGEIAPIFLAAVHHCMRVGRTPIERYELLKILAVHGVRQAWEGYVGLGGKEPYSSFTREFFKNIQNSVEQYERESEMLQGLLNVNGVNPDDAG